MHSDPSFLFGLLIARNLHSKTLGFQETGLRPLSTRLDQLVVCQPLGMPPTFSSSSLDEDVHSIESYVYEPEKVQGYLSAMDERLKAGTNTEYRNALGPKDG